MAASVAFSTGTVIHAIHSNTRASILTWFAITLWKLAIFIWNESTMKDSNFIWYRYSKTYTYPSNDRIMDPSIIQLIHPSIHPPMHAWMHACIWTVRSWGQNTCIIFCICGNWMQEASSASALIQLECTPPTCRGGSQLIWCGYWYLYQILFCIGHCRWPLFKIVLLRLFPSLTCFIYFIVLFILFTLFLKNAHLKL